MIILGALWYISQTLSDYFIVLAHLNVRNIYLNGDSSRVTGAQNTKYFGLMNLYAVTALLVCSVFFWPNDHTIKIIVLVVALSWLSDLMIYFGEGLSKPDSKK